MLSYIQFFPDFDAKVIPERLSPVTKFKLKTTKYNHTEKIIQKGRFEHTGHINTDKKKNICIQANSIQDMQ